MENLISFYQQLLNLQNATFLQIDHEDAMVAVVYKIIQNNGKELILKICDHSNNYLREVFFLKRLEKILPVPQIINVVEPTEDIHGAILMECLPGEILKTKNLTEALAYEIGRCLALIHLNPLPGYGDPIKRDLTADPRVYFTLKFKEGFEECRDHLPIELIRQCQSYYEENVDLLMSADGPCIVHRDFRPANLIVHNDKLQGIIDWAGARASFAEEDFCTFEHGEWKINPYNKKSFLSGYASIRPIPAYQKLMPFLRLNKAIAIIGFTVKRGTWRSTGSSIYQHNRQFLETFFEAIS